jgi:hypothetical protein
MTKDNAIPRISALKAIIRQQLNLPGIDQACEPIPDFGRLHTNGETVTLFSLITMLNSEAAINMCRRILTPCELAGIYQHF